MLWFKINAMIKITDNICHLTRRKVDTVNIRRKNIRIVRFTTSQLKANLLVYLLSCPKIIGSTITSKRNYLKNRIKIYLSPSISQVTASLSRHQVPHSHLNLRTGRVQLEIIKFCIV